MKNNNGAVIRRLTNRSLKANKKRNLFIIMAISLTTFLLGSVFSIGMSLLESKKMEEIRFLGTVAHAAVGHPTASQLEQLKRLDYVKVVGTGNNVGYVKNTEGMGRISLTLHYFDKTEWEKLRSPAFTDIVGSYPQKENEIMVSVGVLEKMGITNPSIGMEIPIAYYTDSKDSDALISENFRLSGWFTSYALIQSMNRADIILVSEELSKKHGKTIETDGTATLMFDDASRVLEYCEKLKVDLNLTENQPVVPAQAYQTGKEATIASLIALSAVIAFLIFTGYLLIYNVMYISVSQDVRFYGLLKTLGTTPKQIKHIVVGQILRLCMIGIPIGALLALLISLVAVPVAISMLGATSTGVVVSFSPLIYLGAAFFALLTALLGAFKPARKAAVISPIEAQKFTGIDYVSNHVYKPTRGKLYKMALRNIFREKKRAVVVLLSLSLGMTTFIAITTLVSGMNINHYIEAMYESDFALKNFALPDAKGLKQKFDDAFMKRLESLPGFEKLNITTLEWVRLEYTPDMFGEYIAAYASMQNGIGNLNEEQIRENFRGFIAGIDGEVLTKLNETLDKPIDIDAFDRGELALIATDNPELFSNVRELTISPLKKSESGLEKTSGGESIKIPLGGFVPYSFKNIGSGFAPTVFISNTLMSKIYQEPVISEINLDVSKEYEQPTLNLLKQFTNDDNEIYLTSKLEAMRELSSAKMVLYVLGVSLALIIALIGVLNFVNVMSVGIMVRRHELAILESIGMSRRQVRKLLVHEGLGYAVITLLLVFTIGNAVTLGIFTLFRQQATFAAYSYPFFPVILVSIIIIAICVITPEVAYHSIYKKSTIIERLRETE